MIRRLAAGVLLAACLGPGAALTTAERAAAAGGVVAIEPPAGKADLGVLRLVTDQGCPDDATNFIVQVSGASFPTGSNAVGNSKLANITHAPNGKGLVVEMLGSWEYVATANGASTKLDGVADLKLLCVNEDATRTLGTMSGSIRFSRNGDGPSAYEQNGGPRLVSGVNTTARTGDEPYIYRYDLPPGSPGGPPAGWTGEVPGAAHDSDVSSSDVDAASTQSEGRQLDGQPTAADGSPSGPPATALIIGGVLMTMAVGVGFVMVRARQATVR
jgi:hypothetical protein